jgi:putative tryptophan/tyrosine transport system substrate-binding protein
VRRFGRSWGGRSRATACGGVLQGLAADDPEGQHRTAVFLQALGQTGWIDGRNVAIELRWAPGASSDLVRKYTAELVALAPDVISCSGCALLAALLAAGRSIPIVFTIVVDTVGAGFVDSLARPGGNATGFSQFEYGISGKWLELLKEIAPGVTRVGVLREPTFTAAVAQLAALQAVAPSMRVELVPLNVRDSGEIERSIAAFARSPADGLIVTAIPLASTRRELIAMLAARHKLPAVYYSNFLAKPPSPRPHHPRNAAGYRRRGDSIGRVVGPALSPTGSRDAGMRPRLLRIGGIHYHCKKGFRSPAFSPAASDTLSD